MHDLIGLTEETTEVKQGISLHMTNLGLIFGLVFSKERGTSECVLF